MTGIGDAEKVAVKPTKRHYSPKTLKVLFALSGNQCAFPDCTNPIIGNATEYSDVVVLGQISHIHPASDRGPRAGISLTQKQRNQAANLILFCPTHHVMVDGQYETYPSPMLLEWKRRHELKYHARVSASIKDIGYAELEVAAKALLARGSASASDLTTIPPDEKIAKNGLGSGTAMMLRMGAAKSKEVGDVILQAAQLDANFPDRLRTGFVEKYIAFKAEGLTGDDLFCSMFEWAGGVSGDPQREAAGLCILAHLFVLCDVFEK